MQMRAAAALLLALLLPAAPAGATDAPLRRFAVVAGASAGAGRAPLRYATSDAREVARVLRRLGGVALDDLVLLEDPDALRLREALARVAVEAQRVRGGGGRVELFVYYSGHSDEDGLLLGGSRLGYAELRRELDRIPADVRVAILDSCASGAITRAKGGVHRPPFLLDASSHVEGHAFLTSSAADEAAQESDRLRGSFFTHALLTGLRGAADTSGDGVVTLNEAYQFAFRETLAGTESSQAGPQHATYDIGLVGSGDVVMTDLRRADALLVVPEALDGRVFVRNGAGQLVAELRKVRGARVELALEEGRYTVQVVRDQKALAATVTVAGNERLVLDETRLWPIALEQTTARGGPPEATQAAPVAGAPARPPPLGGGDPETFRYAASVRGGPLVSMRPNSPAGFLAEVAVDLWRWEIVGLEIAAGYGRVAGTTIGTLPWGLTSFPKQGAEVRDEVTTVPGSATLKLGLPAGRAHPYILGGADLMWVRVDRRPAQDESWLWPQGDHRLSDAAFATTLHAGTGVEVAFGPSLRANLEARYTFGHATVLQQYLLLESFHVTAGIGYSF